MFTKWLIAAEAWLFDYTHNVSTRADKDDAAGANDLSRGFWYIPTRPGTARRLLQHLPTDDWGRFTFVDLGSGKGRMLLAAAGLPFRKIVGVELRSQLHWQALDNVRRYRFGTLACRDIQCLNVDATEFAFPDGNLILYLFKPFGGDILRRVWRRLEESIERSPRDVLVLMHFAEDSSIADESRYFHLHQQTDRWKIYVSIPQVNQSVTTA